MSPTTLRQTLEALWQDLSQDGQYSAELTGAISKASGLAKIAERQALCPHAAGRVQTVVGSGLFILCPQCGKSFGRVEP